MLVFPLGQNASIVVIEPGNIKRMKAGLPLKVGDHLVVFTPDMQAFVRAIGLGDQPLPQQGEKFSREIKLSPDQLLDAILNCKNLPEVDRP